MQDDLAQHAGQREQSLPLLRFAGRGPWKKRLPLLVEILVTLGRARKVRGG